MCTKGRSRMPRSDEQVMLLALCRIKGLDWYLIAREAQRAGGLERLIRATLTEVNDAATKAAALIEESGGSLNDRVAQVRAEIDRAEAVGARLVTVLDEDYPLTLRLIFNLP